MDDAARSGSTADRLSNADIRQANVVAVCRLLRERDDLTRADLAESTGLARPTVVAILQQLIADGFVVEADLRRSPGAGRPASVLRFRHHARVLASVRLVAGTHTEAVLADLAGTVLARSFVARPPATQPASVLVDALVRQVRELHGEHPEYGPLAAVAVCLPGSVDRRRGTWTMPKRRNWSDVSVAESISAALRVPVGVVNVASAALIGQLVLRDAPDETAVLVYHGRESAVPSR